MNLVTPKAAAKHELLFNKPASKTGAKHELLFNNSTSGLSQVLKIRCKIVRVYVP